MISRQPCSIADLLLATSLIAVSLRFATANQSGSWIQLFWLAVAVGLGSGVVVGLVYGSVRRALVAGAAGAVGGAALCYLFLISAADFSRLSSAPWDLPAQP